MIVERTIYKRIKQYLFKGKIVAIYGARQIGKTTLVKELIKKFPEDAIYLNCDEPDVRDFLSSKTSTELKFILGNKRLVVIDEAHRVKEIGLRFLKRLILIRSLCLLPRMVLPLPFCF